MKLKSELDWKKKLVELISLCFNAYDSKIYIYFFSEDQLIYNTL